MAMCKLLKQNEQIKKLIRNKNKIIEYHNEGFPSVQSIYKKYPDKIEKRYD
jgi:hypothetical protein